ncbi:CDP-2,3-bis-(O-geranylgeranyl)-sn-glycerol synthase [Caldivirga sp.]|jgi:CDP-2,3-bis-(O-geranylgeranyl)-sn-glycerol synthase|uniref:CDP-2,3-bis-(O-geranylgeranyl)-sn-glycerol synthase n=1 Tax=Caldivirga sp. TaxID=2080243 RepID=UPI003D0A9F5E
MNIGLLIAQALLIIWPPYVANATPVLAKKVFKGRLHPIDFNKSLKDGKRVLGDGKTYEGFMMGVTLGTLGGYLVVYVIGSLTTPLLKYPTMLDSFVMSVAALLGDMLGAFIKRRLGLRRGEPAPLLDQLDFLLASLLALYLIDPSILPAPVAVTAIIITPPIHLATNAGAYLLGLKSEPW